MFDLGGNARETNTVKGAVRIIFKDKRKLKLSERCNYQNEGNVGTKKFVGVESSSGM